MGDPTVVAQCAAARRSGLFTGVISYNQRCVGRSRGKSRSSSDPDADDLAALCRHLLAQPLPEAAAPARRLVLIGYSYGSCVAAQALSRVPQVRLTG
ncbi:hypothetical protein MNEG_12839 [Monoraphidium neglectum]|uniref:AB hydrolase-1 domain-containing protein n=1 Tax=Monoraphidium neglectum TaxID=145388 RepID=A0A0D2LTZ3_9CHLO|nr:hypothetical protein MNEG_12839 [Monoraphidium neglectum]KIY95124.1 hypothetical protein MNEG_12839 [Monoraphidium neglectum]|eukprot:XP_013894144.1 hypothetical protein MNEG_12839 [Monoraphidium neglectum]